MIPSHPRRAVALPCDFALYRERNLVELRQDRVARAGEDRVDEPPDVLLGPGMSVVPTFGIK